MENILKLKDNYSLKTIRNFDDFFDFDIFYNDENIGILELRIYDEIFIRQIRIDENFKRRGHAGKVVDNLINYFNKPVSLCVATTSESAVAFWDNYLKTKEEVINTKGNIYKIYK